eukprot:EG_transcript_17142
MAPRLPPPRGPLGAPLCPLRELERQVRGIPPPPPRPGPITTLRVSLRGLSDCPRLSLDSAAESSSNSSGILSPLHCEDHWREDLAVRTAVRPVGPLRCGVFAAQPLKCGDTVAPYGHLTRNQRDSLPVLAAEEPCASLSFDLANDPKARAVRFCGAGNAGLRLVNRRGRPCLEAYVVAPRGIAEGAEVVLGLAQLQAQFEGSWEPPQESVRLSSSSSSSGRSSDALAGSDCSGGKEAPSGAVEAAEVGPLPPALGRVTVETLALDPKPFPKVYPKDPHPLGGLAAISARGPTLATVVVAMQAPPPPPPSITLQAAPTQLGMPQKKRARSQCKPTIVPPPPPPPPKCTDVPPPPAQPL